MYLVGQWCWDRQSLEGYRPSGGGEVGLWKEEDEGMGITTTATGPLHLLEGQAPRYDGTWNMRMDDSNKGPEPLASSFWGWLVRYRFGN